MGALIICNCFVCLLFKSDPIKKQLYARGKLLLTGEYAVLHGAQAVAFPLKLGQRMTIQNARGSDLIWESLDVNGEIWFEAQLSLYDFSPIKSSDDKIAKTLKKILRAAVRENSEFLSTWSGFKVETKLEFPREWGLGSSSTLISLVANWAEVSPFHLYFDVFNGSGYDIACAEADEAIQYQLSEDQLHFHEFDFKPPFLKDLYFVYQGQKQDSESAIKAHGNKFKKKPEVIERISAISEEMASIQRFESFCQLLEEHEKLIGDTIGEMPVKEKHFSDFPGTLKSLGAWGGDFLLAASREKKENIEAYFHSRKLDTVIPFKELVYGS